jgi:hypothetical protein
MANMISQKEYTITDIMNSIKYIFHLLGNINFRLFHSQSRYADPFIMSISLTLQGESVIPFSFSLGYFNNDSNSS